MSEGEELMELDIDDLDIVLDAEEAAVLEVPAPKQKKSKKATAATTLDEVDALSVSVSRGKMSVEDQIGDVGGDKEYARILLYGRNKTGKTTGAVGDGEGTLVIKFEDGTLSVRGTKAKEYPKKGKVEIFEQVEDLYWYLKTKCNEGTPPFKRLVFDTLTRMRQLVLRHTVLGSAAFDPTKDVMAPNRKDYGEAGQKMIYWLAAFAELPMHIVWLCQERSGGEDEEMSQFEGYPDLPTQVRNYVLGDADVIGRTFKKAVEKDGKSVTSFRIKFGPDESFVTGDRTKTLPTIVANPKMEDLLVKMFGVK